MSDSIVEIIKDLERRVRKLEDRLNEVDSRTSGLKRIGPSPTMGPSRKIKWDL